MLKPGLATLAVGGLVLTLSACGPTITAPNVVGMRLDAAHRKFEALNTRDFKDTDNVQHRNVLWDSHWVVIAQDPPAGATHVDTDTTIKLSVVNQDYKKLLDLIPSDSPEAVARQKQKKEAAAKAAKDAAAEAKEAADAKAKELAARKKYVETVDPVTRVGRDSILEISAFIDHAQAGMSDGALTSNVDQAGHALDLYVSSLKLADVPSDLNTDVNALMSAINEFKLVPRTLLSANGSDRKGSVARARDVYEEASAKYNRALTAIYGNTELKPPALHK